MKDTGIIRRIDDLGRIVIPKEIRKKLKINEGEKLEIFINEEQIVLQKYSSVKSIKNIASKITDSIYSLYKDIIIITDNETVVAVSGKNKKELLNKEISDELISIIKKRNNEILNNINIVDNVNVEGKYKINVITENGDINGSIILISDEITKEKEQIINVNATFLSKYLEE